MAKFRVNKDRAFVKEKFNATTFPTVLAIKDGEFFKYESENRSVSAMKKFLKSFD